MPREIKELIRKYAEAEHKASILHDALAVIFEEYKVPYDNLIAINDDPNEPNTEALADINNGDYKSVEDSIAEIEKVFLYFVNREGA